MEDETDDANVEDAGLDDRCGWSPANSISWVPSSTRTGILKLMEFGAFFQSADGRNLVPAGPMASTTLSRFHRRRRKGGKDNDEFIKDLTQAADKAKFLSSFSTAALFFLPIRKIT